MSISILICSLIIGIILGIIAFIFAEKVLIMSTKSSSILCGILICGLSTILSIGAIKTVTDSKGSIIVVSCEKIAEADNAVNIINNGYYYEKQKSDGKLVKHDVGDIYFDETVNAVYLQTRYHKLWIFKLETEKILLIPESVESDLVMIQQQKNNM